MNFPDVDDIKVMLGIDASDTSKDQAIQTQLDVVLAIIENYCDRHFTLGPYEDFFLPFDTRNPYLLLRARPVVSVEEVQRDDRVDPLGNYTLIKHLGVLRQEMTVCRCAPNPCLHGENVLVKYTGGWADDQWPADFIDVFLQVFMARWNAMGGSGNYAQGGGSGGTGEIKSFAVGQVKIDYDVGTSSSASSGASAGASVPPELAPFTAVLDKYGDRRAYGV